MGLYHNIKIDHNSDCCGEIEALLELLKENKSYLSKDFSNNEIMANAIDELYNLLVAKKKNGENQRSV